MKKQKQGYSWDFHSKLLPKKLIIVVLIGLSACVASKSIAPTPEALPVMKQRVPDITYERASAGYELYKNKCAGCHRLYAPSEYTMAKWQIILPRMYVKSKMTSTAEKNLVRDYLYSLSK